MKRIAKSKSVQFFTALVMAMWVTALVSIGLVTFSYLLPQDLTRSREPYATLAAISFFGRVLTFHFGLSLGMIGIVAACLRRRFLVIVCGVFTLVFLSPTLLSLFPPASLSAKGPAFRLMSMNLKYDLYDGELILQQVRKFNPDVLVLQDFLANAQPDLNHQLAGIFPHRHLQPNGLQGMAIFSRYPIESTNLHTPSSTSATSGRIHRQMRTVIDFNNQPIVIYVEHPYSPRSRRRIISNRLATAQLAQQIKAEKLPVIAAGDFNFTAETPNEDALKAVGMQDGFELASTGRGATWPVAPRWLQWLPGVRIDHIFLSAGLTCTRFEVGEFDGSDHLPIVADISIAIK